MNEKIVQFFKGSFPKKYTAHIQDKKTKKIRKLHFGDSRYQQYKDRTPLKLYKNKNHGTRKRMQNYYSDIQVLKIVKMLLKKKKRKVKDIILPKY